MKRTRNYRFRHLFQLTRRRLGPALVSVVALWLLLVFAVKLLVDDANWVYAIGCGLLFTVGVGLWLAATASVLLRNPEE